MALIEAELESQARGPPVTNIRSFIANLGDATTGWWGAGLDGVALEALLDYDPRAFSNAQLSEAQIDFLLQLHVERTKC